MNPAMSEIGIISKHYLELVNNKIREKIQMNQIPNPLQNGLKQSKIQCKSSFIKFDIVEFYPSISKELLSEAIEYA